MERPVTRPDRFAAAIAIQLALSLTGLYFTYIERPAIGARIDLHRQILEASAPNPYPYRVLIPAAAEALVRTFRLGPGFLGSGARPYMAAYLVLNAAALLLFFLSLQRLLRRWFSFPASLIGILVAGGVVALTFRDHYFHPWSFWEAAFFALGLLFIVEGRPWAFTAVNLIGIANRETSVLLPLMLAFIVWPPAPSLWRRRLSRPEVRFAAANLMLWAAGTAALRWIIGSVRPELVTVEGTWNGNRANWPYALLLNSLVLGPLWFYVARGFLAAPPPIRRAAGVVPIYCGLLLVVGYWWEIRYWMSMLPILIPCLVASLEPAERLGVNRAFLHFSPKNARLHD